MPLEFARVSDGGELAIVLCEGAAPMPTQWAMLEVPDLATARELLRQREAIDAKHPEWVGSIPSPRPSFCWEQIRDWMRDRGLVDAVWTALPPRVHGDEGRMPTEDEAVSYLQGLEGHVRDHARDYVERVPARIFTPYRTVIEQRLGWTAPKAI